MQQELLESSDNQFISGPGGTGKTYLVKQLEAEWIANGTKYVILAATGVAAINIGGQTIHRYFGIGLGVGEKEQLLKMAQLKGVGQRLRDLDIMVIDELSMVGNKLFELMDFICCRTRKSPRPFGGLRVILTGDFLQLPPVKERFAFTSDVWDKLELKPIILTEPKRFDDFSYWKMLLRARVGKLKRKDVVRFEERIDAYKEYKKKPSKIEPTMLYAHRADVDAINEQKLNALGSKECCYTADDENDVKTDESVKILDLIAPSKVKFKVGAQVMCTRNVNVEEGICNGSRGVITACESDHVAVLFLNGQTVRMGFVQWEVEYRNKKINRSQIPLMLAWAITVHKVQGLTIDFAVLDLGPSIFSPGQAYVALSRVKNYKSLLLSNFSERSIFANPEAIAFYSKLGSE